MDPLVAAIDQGTSSTRFLVSDVVDALGSCFVFLHFIKTICRLLPVEE